MHRAVGENGIPGQDACAAQGDCPFVIDRDYDLSATQGGINLLVLEQWGVRQIVDQDVLSDDCVELFPGEGPVLEGVVVWGKDRDGAASRV
jgi:hypothetical protein